MPSQPPVTQLAITYYGKEQVLQVAESDVITFPEGLIGFADWRRFVLLEDPDEAPLCVLFCIDHPEVSFITTNPWHVCTDYQLRLTDELMRSLGLESEEHAQALCILAAKDGSVRVTANLIAPIVINPRTRLAHQIILQDSDYSVQYPVLMTATMEANSRS